MRRGPRGLVLLQVLGGALIVGFMCASIMSLALQPALQGADLVGGLRRTLSAQASVNRVAEAWTGQGRVCVSDFSLQVSCGGVGCDCTCSVQGLPDVVARPSGPGAACVLKAVAP